MYRNPPHVTKNTNLTIYCIMNWLADWSRRNNGHYPEQLYVQMDGGPENANHYVIVFLEMLVAKRICRRIIFSR